MTELVIVLCLILANAIFAGAEIAILSVRKTRIAELASQGNRSARALMDMRGHPENFLATVQIGITVVGATAAAFGGATVAAVLSHAFERAGVGRYSDDLALAVVVGSISYLSLVLGELVPKSLALRSAERYALFVARPLKGLAHIARPLVWFLTASSNVVLRAFGDRTTFTEAQLSKEELQQLVEEAATVGALDQQSSEIARRALEFGDVHIAAIMVPRQDMIAIQVDSTPEEIRRVLTPYPHSRIPVYATELADVVGYVTLPELFALLTTAPRRPLGDILRKPHFVPESKRAVDVLRELQKSHEQLVFVVDESGLVTGLATIEDLVEELVGEIFAEHDTVRERIKKESDRTVLVRGRVPVHELNRELGLELLEGPGWTTVGGLATSLAGRMPVVGERLAAGKVTLEIVEATERRVMTVRIHLSREEADSET